MICRMTKTVVTRNEEEKEFVECVLNDKPVPVGGNDGLQPVRIAMAAKKSLDEGRPVKLDEIEN